MRELVDHTRVSVPEIEIAERGSYVRLRGGLGGQPGQRGGLRGKIRGFSAASRKRLLDWLNSVDKLLLASGLFVHLTYPDLFPEDAARWKRDIDAFGKRLKRKFPRVTVIWRLEMKERKSGENEGVLAPHFHLLVFGVKLVPKDWLSWSWYEIVGSGDTRHLAAGTRVERIRSRRGVLWYVSKYIAKVDEQVLDLEIGRWWGIVGRDNLPVHLLRVRLTWEQFYQIRRVLRRWLGRRLKKKLKYAGLRGQGITAYLGAETAGRVLAWALSS